MWEKSLSEKKVFLFKEELHYNMFMEIEFENAPLVELIAEVRWGVPSFPSYLSPAGVTPNVLVSSDQDDEFFRCFGDKAATIGFVRSESLIPLGFQAMPFQPAVRYPRVSSAGGTHVYQLGKGFFSAHATPPYRSWKDFSPVVTAGVKILLECRLENEKNLPFNVLNLRYIDAFTHSLTQGRKTIDFISKILGFDIKIPASILNHAKDPSQIVPFIQLTVPINYGQIHLVIAEGKVNNEPSIIYDTTISRTDITDSSIENVMGAFDSIHDLMREIFIGLTGPISDLMKPKENK